jgi:hypothetical protein
MAFFSNFVAIENSLDNQQKPSRQTLNGIAG